jgi:hypothetical protein
MKIKADVQILKNGRKKMKRLTKKIFVCLCAVSIMMFFINMVSAQDGTPAPQTATQEQQVQLNNPRTFALGITTLKEHGFGGMMRGRWDHFAVDFAAGGFPWLIMYQTADGTTTNYDFDMSLHADLGFIVFINSDQSRFQNGIRVAGIYDSIGGKGAMFGWTGELTFNTFALCFGVGLQYYPDLIKKVNEHFPATQDAELDSSFKYQWYLGVNFMWYLF